MMPSLESQTEKRRRRPSDKQGRKTWRRQVDVGYVGVRVFTCKLLRVDDRGAVSRRQRNCGTVQVTWRNFPHR